jgi:hypothetical protein
VPSFQSLARKPRSASAKASGRSRAERCPVSGSATSSAPWMCAASETLAPTPLRAETSHLDPTLPGGSRGRCVGEDESPEPTRLLQRSAHGCEPADRETHHDEVVGHVPHREALVVGARAAVPSVVEIEDPVPRLDHRDLRPLAGTAHPMSDAAGTAAEHLTAETRRTPPDATELPPGPDTTCLLSRRVRP